MKWICGKSRLLHVLVACFCFSCSAVAADMYGQVKSDIQANRTEAALKTLRTMVKQQPDDYQAWFLFGVATARQQQYHQAIEAFRRVVELKPLLAEQHNILAVLYNELGDVRAAIRELEQSLKKRPGYAIAEENIADLYVKLALKNYRSALKKDPTPELEKRYARLLQVRDPEVSALKEKQSEQVAAPVMKKDSVKKEVIIAQEKPVGVPVKPLEVAAKPAPVMDTKVKKEVADNQLPITQQIAEGQVLKAIEAWRMAWSKRDMENYFVAYAENFTVPERFASLKEWQSYKQRVIGSKTYIQVELSDLSVKMDETNSRAKVKFFQKFRSNSYNGDDMKVLEMKLDDNRWKIVKEDSIS
jgi:Flp pilus assembly protein TadD